MTKDVQHDRSASPLATVSDAIHPPTRSRMPATTGHDTPSVTAEPDIASTFQETSSSFDSESFEGFGSFG